MSAQLKYLVAVSVLAFSALACTQAVEPLPTSTPASIATVTAIPSPTARPSTTPAADTSVIVQAVVQVHIEPDVDSEVVDWLLSGHEVDVLEIRTDKDGGEWVRIGADAWVWAGCVEGVNDAGCEAR